MQQVVQSNLLTLIASLTNRIDNGVLPLGSGCHRKHEFDPLLLVSIEATCSREPFLATFFLIFFKN